MTFILHGRFRISEVHFHAEHKYIMTGLDKDQKQEVEFKSSS